MCLKQSLVDDCMLQIHMSRQSWDHPCLASRLKNQHPISKYSKLSTSWNQPLGITQDTWKNPQIMFFDPMGFAKKYKTTHVENKAPTRRQEFIGPGGMRSSKWLQKCTFKSCLVCLFGFQSLETRRQLHLQRLWKAESFRSFLTNKKLKQTQKIRTTRNKEVNTVMGIKFKQHSTSNSAYVPLFRATLQSQSEPPPPFPAGSHPLQPAKSPQPKEMSKQSGSLYKSVLLYHYV